MSTNSFGMGSDGSGGENAEQMASEAAMAAADNLFAKVVRALLSGDEARARRLAVQTAQRPFDEREGVWPGPWAAHFAIFQLVTDAVEEWPEGDSSWVDALAGLVAETSGAAQVELRHLAAVLDQDAPLLSIDEHEASRLGGVAGGADPAVEPSQQIDEGERADCVLELARLVIELEHRLDDAQDAAWVALSEGPIDSNLPG